MDKGEDGRRRFARHCHIDLPGSRYISTLAATAAGQHSASRGACQSLDCISWAYFALTGGAVLVMDQTPGQVTEFLATLSIRLSPTRSSLPYSCAAGTL